MNKMKKILLLLIATIPLMAVQCSEEETPVAENCNCERVVYKYGVFQFMPDGITPIWSYKEQSRTASESDCNSETGYISMGGVYYYRIECE